MLFQQGGSSAAAIRLRKEILLDGVKRTIHEAIGAFTAVIFLPQMSRIIEGGPEERRRYLNLALSQTIPGYSQAISDYGQALTQRNALLKTLYERGGNSDQLDVWDEALARLGAQIILWRIEAVQQIERLASRVHQKKPVFLGNKETVFRQGTRVAEVEPRLDDSLAFTRVGAQISFHQGPYDLNAETFGFGSVEVRRQANSVIIDFQPVRSLRCRSQF